MSFDQKKLTETLSQMKDDYFRNPKRATTSQSFIRKLHGYCKYEFEQKCVDGNFIQLEKKVSGSHSEKSVDISVIGPQNNKRDIATGPLITVSIKSQMSSISNNFQTVYDRIVGEVLNLHNRFPLLVANCLYLYPTHGYKKPREGTIQGKRIKHATEGGSISDPKDYGKEAIDFDLLSKKYSLITRRKDPSDFPDKHEHFALLVVDFDSNPPKIQKDFVKNPLLLIDNFFDNIYEDYLKRNASFL